LRGKSWFIEEERQLLILVNNGVSVEDIAQIMGKTMLSIKGQDKQIEFTVVVVARQQHTAVTTTITTTSPEPIRHPL
jgi:hypothetical protein